MPGSIPVVLALVLVREEAQDSDEEVYKVEEELEGMVGNVLVSLLGLQDHHLSVINDIKGE